MNEMKLTDDDDGDTLEEKEDEPKLSDDNDGDTPEVEEEKECCDDSEKQTEWDKFKQETIMSLPSEENNKDVRGDWEEKIKKGIANDIEQKEAKNKVEDDIEFTKEQREAKDKINEKIMNLIMYRSERKWFATIAVISIFGTLLVLMLSFVAMGKDLMPEWKEILLVMLGAFVGSFARVIDHYFNNSQAEEKLLESAND